MSCCVECGECSCGVRLHCTVCLSVCLHCLFACTVCLIALSVCLDLFACSHGLSAYALSLLALVD